MAALASLMTMFHKIWGSLGARFLPGFGFEPFRPTEIKPIYFPAWLIDAEVEADISFVNQGETLQVSCCPNLLNTINGFDLPASCLRTLC